MCIDVYRVNEKYNERGRHFMTKAKEHGQRSSISLKFFATIYHPIAGWCQYFIGATTIFCCEWLRLHQTSQRRFRLAPS